MKTRTKSLVVTVVVGGVMAIASLAWACTVLVGPAEITDTEETPPSSGSDVSAVGFASHDLEPAECDDASSEVGDDTELCDYEIVSVSTAVAFSCHFNEGDEDESSEAQETTALGGTELTGTVAAPAQPGEAVVCFRSKETFTGDSGDAPAAGTSGAPFLVMD